MAEECSHECSSCGVSGCGDRTAEAGPSTLAPNNRTNVKHVIGVVSGKGGVGKSLVTSLLASEMNKRGHKVAILDADITGPSIPKSFGVDSRLTADADGINPAKSASGIEVMSVNLMLPEGDMPVAWRGPVVTGASKQFWQEAVSYTHLMEAILDAGATVVGGCCGTTPAHTPPSAPFSTPAPFPQSSLPPPVSS